MGWFKQLSLSWIILSVVAACVSCQELTSTLRQGNRTCPGEEVIFTCTVRGPSSLSDLALAWSSAEYIGQSSSLQLSTANMIGHVETSTDMDGNITATATLTNNANVNGELLLESTLRITATVASMVTCSGTNGDPASIEFTISAVPGVPLDITASEISRSDENNICVILVQWAPPTNSDMSDIAQYIVHVPLQDINVTVSSAPPTFTTFLVRNCGDGIRVRVAAVNRDGCVGMNSSEVQATLRPTVSTDNVSATTEGGSTSTSSQLGVGAILGITISMILLALFFLSLVFVCIYCVCIAGKRTGKPTEMEEVLLREVSTIRQKDFRKNLMDLYIAIKKDWSEDDKLSSVESLSQMMENRTLSKRYIKEALKIALKTIKLDHGGGVKKVLVYLKINVPKVLSSFNNELEDKDTMDSLIRAAEQNEHAEVFDKLIEIMDNTEPEIVEELLRTMFEELQNHLQSKVSSIEVKWVTNLPGGEVHMELPP